MTVARVVRRILAPQQEPIRWVHAAGLVVAALCMMVAAAGRGQADWLSFWGGVAVVATVAATVLAVIEDAKRGIDRDD